VNKEKSIVFMQIIGAILFFGGILSSIVINTVITNSLDVTSNYYHHQLVSQITYSLTVPGMWVSIVAIPASLFIKKINPFQSRVHILILFLMLLILTNGIAFLSPIIDEVTLLVQNGFSSGELPQNYQSLKSKEYLLGAVNFIMALIVFIFMVFRGFVKPKE